MKTRLILLPLIVSTYLLLAQSIYGMVNDNQALTLTAPGSNVFISITFASYGTPIGSCGSFTIGGCHASNSMNIVQTAFLGNHSASIGANNGMIGHPCGGTFKRLYIETVYGTTLPVRLLFFSGKVSGSTHILQWETTDENNCRQFEVERSTDSFNFLSAGIVAANNRLVNNRYSFTENFTQTRTFLTGLKCRIRTGNLCIVM
jgi:hypothetical protein